MVRIACRSVAFSSIALLSACAGAQSSYTDIYPTTPDSFFGEGLSMLDDVNGDGFVDFTGASRSFAAIYSGRTGTELTYFPNCNLAQRAGDIDGDGVQDMVMRVAGTSNLELRLHAGGTWTVDPSFTGVPNGAITPLGDVDGDGTDDIAIIASRTCYVYSGATKAQIFVGSGRAVCVMGDLNGDGVNDFATQTPSETTLRTLVGPALTVPPIPRVHGGFPGGMSSCTSPGDVDGDGVPDLAAAESYASVNGSRSGEVFLYSGATGAMLQRFPGPRAQDRFGRSMATMGDVNGDGIAELLIGTAGFRASVFDVAAGVELASIVGLLHQFNPLDAGMDLTGDGVPDGLVGVPRPTAGGATGYIKIVSGATLTFSSDALEIPADNGGTVNFQVDVGPARAGDTYFVLGSLVEPVPNWTIGGATIPLSNDFYFDYLLYNTNTLISSSFGTLDVNGRASAVLSAGPGYVPAALAGAVFRHASVIVSGATPLLATNYMPLEIR